MRTVIGFTGVARCGKGTAAQHLVEHYNFRLVKFAGPLKDMCRSIGLTENQIEGDEKELPCDLIGGKSPRFFMQHLGTGFGRNTISQDIWIRLWRHRVSEVPDGIGVVADDVRFQNEALAIADLGGKVIRIRADRPGVGIAGSHASELQVVPANITIDNSGYTDKFLEQIDHLVQEQFHLSQRG